MRVINLSDANNLCLLGELMEQEAKPTAGKSEERYILAAVDEEAISDIKSLGWACVNGDRYLGTINREGKRIDALVGMIDGSGSHVIMPVDMKLKVSSSKHIAGYTLLKELLEKYHDSKCKIELEQPGWFTTWSGMVVGVLASAYLEQARSNLNRRQVEYPEFKLLVWHSPVTFKSAYG